MVKRVMQQEGLVIHVLRIAVPEYTARTDNMNHSHSFTAFPLTPLTGIIIIYTTVKQIINLL